MQLSDFNLRKALGMPGGDENQAQMAEMMTGMVKELSPLMFSKDVLAEPIKQLAQLYPNYIAEHACG
eukprot:SAG31_NODE_3998_length_3677_cov_10.286193_2_plen_67_part_00